MLDRGDPFERSNELGACDGVAGDGLDGVERRAGAGCPGGLEDDQGLGRRGRAGVEDAHGLRRELGCAAARA